jgi:hypothetical protein
MKRTDSQETPPTPLYDEDMSQPLEPFPRMNYAGEGVGNALEATQQKENNWAEILEEDFREDCISSRLCFIAAF